MPPCMPWDQTTRFCLPGLLHIFFWAMTQRTQNGGGNYSALLRSVAPKTKTNHPLHSRMLLILRVLSSPHRGSLRYCNLLFFSSSSSFPFIDTLLSFLSLHHSSLLVVSVVYFFSSPVWQFLHNKAINTCIDLLLSHLFQQSLSGGSRHFPESYPVSFTCPYMYTDYLLTCP